MTLIKYQNVPSFNGLFDELLKENNTRKAVTLPKVNIKEDENEYAIELAVPGMEKEDFKIEVDNDLLTVTAEPKNKEEDKSYTRKEFGYYAFTRTFRMPETANGEKVAASYKNGVLMIAIPKMEKAKPKAIKVA